MKIAVMGVGHIGLVTAAVLASAGHEVVGTDTDHPKIAQLQSGVVPFYEPGLKELIDSVPPGNLSFTSAPVYALSDAEVAFICVGTPQSENGDADLRAVDAAATAIAVLARDYVVVVQKSTVPAGTSERVVRAMSRYRDQSTFDVVSNPEFLREGSAVEDSMNPDRIVIGSDSERAREVMRRVYALETPLVEVSIQAAELSKHASNAFLATKISFANALARISERFGADVQDVTRIMGMDHRIGSEFLQAGLGWGGYCFPKDVTAFSNAARSVGYEFGLLDEAAKINDDVIEVAASRINALAFPTNGSRIAVLGLSFKPGTDDVRSSQQIRLARRLLDQGATVVGYDPVARTAASLEEPRLWIESSPYEAASGASCVVIATAWPELRSLSLGQLGVVMRQRAMLDAVNLLDPAAAASAGFTYASMGRPQLLAAPVTTGDAGGPPKGAGRSSSEAGVPTPVAVSSNPSRGGRGDYEPV